MNHLNLLKAITLGVMAFCFSVEDASAQKVKKVKLSTDTLDMNTALFRKSDYKKVFEAKGKKKITQSVSFDVETLREILDAYDAKGVKEIKFQFAIIRQEDVQKYVNKHPEQALSQDQRDDLVERPTLLIRVPRNVVDELAKNTGNAGNSGNPGGSSANMSAAKMGDATGADSFIDVGSICPPPTQCDEEL